MNNVVLRDWLPSGLRVYAEEVTGGAACSGSWNCDGPVEYLTWPAWTLAPGEVQAVTFTAYVTGLNGTVLHNRATLSWDGMPAEMEVSEDVLVSNL